jgi:hypothetical protein
MQEVSHPPPSNSLASILNSKFPPHQKYSFLFYSTLLIMENSDLWGTMDDHSIFLEDDHLNLFGDDMLSLDFDQFPASVVGDWFNPPVDSAIERDFTAVPTASQDEWTNYSTDADILYGSGDLSELCIQHPDYMRVDACTNGFTARHMESVQSSQEDQERDNTSLSMKRKIEDSIIVFSANSDAKIIPKRRKTFSKSRKREVAMNRLIGACVQCKLRKGPVSCTYSDKCLNIYGHNAEHSV